MTSRSSKAKEAAATGTHPGSAAHAAGVHIGLWSGPTRLGQVVLRGLSAGGASLAGSLYERYRAAGRLNHAEDEAHIVMNNEQSAYLLVKLDSARPPSEVERTERQRQLFADASNVELHSVHMRRSRKRA